MIYIIYTVIAVLFVVTFAWREVEIYREGGDVYEWTKKLSDWLKRK